MHGVRACVARGEFGGGGEGNGKFVKMILLLCGKERSLIFIKWNLINVHHSSS